jgi:hypothetical protein
MLQGEVGHCDASHVDGPPPAPLDELPPPPPLDELPPPPPLDELPPPAPLDEFLPPPPLEEVPPALVVPPAPTSAPPEPGLSTVASIAISMPPSARAAVDRSARSS